MLNKILRIVFPIVAIVLGIVAIFSGVQKLKTKDLYDATTTAVISDLQREWRGTDSDGFDEYDYIVFVDYEVDGKKYEHVQYPSYSSSMKVGDSIDILYQSANPETISETNITGHATIFIIAGAAIVLIALLAGVKAIIRR